MKILVMNDKSLFYDYFKEKGFGVAVYRNANSSIMRALRRFHHKSGLPFFSVWYSKEFMEIDEDERTVIVFDSMLTVKPANYLKSKYVNLRVIFWHWNHIDYPYFFKNINNNIERWSYDTVDCSQYKLFFNTQFYISDFAKGKETKIERDCYFIGAVKSRGEYINKCKDEIDRAGLSSLFVLSENTRRDRERKWVDYCDILKYVKSSRCVVDIVPDNQYGMTIRPLEALFLKKKLITNYKGIKECDFYHPDNIFILDEDDGSCLSDFVRSPFNDSVSKFSPYYDVMTWLKRFSIEE